MSKSRELKYEPRSIYLTFSLLAFFSFLTAIAVKNIYVANGMFFVLSTASYFVVNVTNGKVFFFDRKVVGTYNLLYPFSVMAGALIVLGAGSVNVIPFEILAVNSLAAAGLLFVANYILLRKFWNGFDSTLSILCVSLLAGVGVTFSLSSALWSHS
ncbi:hypothetical protein AUP74_01129 [Microbulbifer aggregans]|uniref:Uncharacterized protein n=1 Tax=Microbulbifer aggregans TaxID=1769779 RepID=A0A1C9W635_9GAMM|nr:hypothetical protein [Microbulbifer aggregans]AOS96593.1 hypothetical protein AUP74_01129 [Microbulbifer aggregans]